MIRLQPDNNRTQSQQPIWIDTPSNLEQLYNHLCGERIVAVDTESDSLYSYFEKVCLIQFSTHKADYLVDPLSMDISCLAEFFADPSVQKVFHAAEYDILSLKRDCDFTFANLFDTMLAAKILGWSRYGLGNILREHFGVTLDKRFQRYNWGQRPLSQKALDYARLDTHYLLPLRKIQQGELQRQHRQREAAEAFERQTQVLPSPKMFNPDDFWRIKGSRDLKPKQRAVLRELFIVRDHIARRIDRPPFKVMNDSTLVALARRQPASPDDLKLIKGLSKNVLQHDSTDILEAIQTGRSVSPPRYSGYSNHRPDGDTLNRYETLRHWRNTLAGERGVEPDVIISNETLMHIARRNPKNLNALTKMKSLGDWQREVYGQALLDVLKNGPSR